MLFRARGGSCFLLTFLPEAVRDNAADKLAKLKGFYPDNSGKGGGQANVQINFINPYAKPEVVVNEAD